MVHEVVPSFFPLRTRVFPSAARSSVAIEAFPPVSFRLSRTMFSFRFRSLLRNTKDRVSASFSLNSILLYTCWFSVVRSTRPA